MTEGIFIIHDKLHSARVRVVQRVPESPFMWSHVLTATLQ